MFAQDIFMFDSFGIFEDFPESAEDLSYFVEPEQNLTECIQTNSQTSDKSISNQQSDPHLQQSRPVALEVDPQDAEILQKIMNTKRNPKHMFQSVEQLLQAYPSMRLDLEDKVSIEIMWRDIVKKAAPKKSKNALKYDPVELDHLMVAAYQRMLEARNHVKHILSVIKAQGNKKLILRLVGLLEGCPDAYVAGGAPSPSTRRVIMFYETEGGVTAVKRKSSPVEVDTSASVVYEGHNFNTKRPRAEKVEVNNVVRCVSPMSHSSAPVAVINQPSSPKKVKTIEIYSQIQPAALECPAQNVEKVLTAHPSCLSFSNLDFTDWSTISTLDEISSTERYSVDQQVSLIPCDFGMDFLNCFTDAEFDDLVSNFA